MVLRNQDFRVRIPDVPPGYAIPILLIWRNIGTTHPKSYNIQPKSGPRNSNNSKKVLAGIWEAKTVNTFSDNRETISIFPVYVVTIK